MWTAETKQHLSENLRNAPRPVILVPTMGALHPAHASLIQMAREQAGPSGTVIVSIFVNPIQFDKKSDLENYPRPLAADLAVCQAKGADGVFIPQAGEMYTPDRSITVLESKLSKHLCGASRPGHFDGVCTVVLKLFNLTGCNSAIFGEKDFQQLAIIHRMVRDLDLKTEILSHPTLRETDGLAMSSRNRRLNTEQRADAPRIYQALLTAAQEKTAPAILESATAKINNSTLTEIDYISLVDPETLESTTDLKHPTILACAVFYGEIRLIDHIKIAPLQR